MASLYISTKLSNCITEKVHQKQVKQEDILILSTISGMSLTGKIFKSRVQSNKGVPVIFNLIAVTLNLLPSITILPQTTIACREKTYNSHGNPTTFNFKLKTAFIAQGIQQSIHHLLVTLEQLITIVFVTKYNHIVTLTLLMFGVYGCVLQLHR